LFIRVATLVASTEICMFISFLKEGVDGVGIEPTTVGAKSPPTVEAVLALADTLVAYVMETPEQTVKKDLFDMPNDVEVE